MTTKNTRSEVITLKKIEHRKRSVILLLFRDRRDWLIKVKKMKGVLFTRTHLSYYIEYDKRAFHEFKKLGLPYTLDGMEEITNTKTIKNPTTDTIAIGHAQGVPSAQHIPYIGADNQAPPSGPADKGTQSATDISKTNIGDMDVVFSNKHFLIKINYDKKKVEKIKKLNKVWWHAKTKKWICYASVYNLGKIQAMLECWTEEQYEQLEEMIMTYEDPCTVTLYSLPDRRKEIFIEVKGFKKVIAPIHQLSNRRYDKELSRWVIPYDMKVLPLIKEEYLKYDIEVIDRLPATVQAGTKLRTSNGDRLSKLLKKFTSSDLEVAKKIASRMMGQRYSWQTIKMYTTAMVKYRQWLLPKKMTEETTQQDITKYTIHLSSLKLSSSYMNIQISALKYYFSKVQPRSDLNVQMIDRPKARYTLPRILSQQEVLRMIEVTTNIKHRNILYAIYSSGLRLTELISLKIEDINYDRKQIIVRGGKGNKDRSVMLSDHLAEVLRAYFHKYKPSTYLFESIKAGKQYSTSSIQKIVRQSASKAQISQKVTPHVLRHCFATHLHDRGISIASIQELLGHKNIKTTLVYTHISTQNLTSIESPLDRMMQKKKP